MTLSFRRIVPHHSSFDWMFAVILLGGLALVGCQKETTVSKIGEPVTVGGLEINVEGYEVRRLEVVEDDRTYEYDEPVLAVDVTFTNKGKDPFMYSPTHESRQMSQKNSPLLYPKPEQNLSSPGSEPPIKGVVLEEGKPKGQITEPTPIKPGKTLRDILLYEVPDSEKADFILSIPPSMHRGQRPVLFDIPYTYEEPKGPETHAPGDAITRDGVTFTVTSSKLTYIETKHPEKGKGFSSEPLFRVNYKITNKSDQPITYTPGHSAVSGSRTETLHADGDPIGRVTFTSSDRIPGWVTEATTIKPSKSLEDMSIFESPGRDVESVRFEFPASRFERSGLIRVNIPYTYEKPETPKPLQADEDEE